MGQRDKYDHFTIWLKSSNDDWGPSPLIFNNYWTKHKDFSKFIGEEWKKIEVTGRGYFILKKKLRKLRMD